VPFEDVKIRTTDATEGYLNLDLTGGRRTRNALSHP
jgi:hypothetical protein